MEQKILIIEDEPAFVVWIQPILNEIFPQQKILFASCIEEARLALTLNELSLVILDIGLPDGNGLSLLKQLKSQNTAARCIISSSHHDQDSILNAIQSGADGYIVKNGDVKSFKSLLKKISKGEPALSDSVSQTLIDFIQKTSTPKYIPDLTSRQTEVLSMLAKGSCNKEIASRLKISTYTVTDHIKHLYQRLGIKSRAEAAVIAIRLKLL